MPAVRSVDVVSCVALLVGGVTNAACLNLSGGDCTAIACVTQATVDLQSTTGAWPPGTYELSVVTDSAADGGRGSCVLQIPNAPSPTLGILATCMGRLGLTFSGVSSCEMLMRGGATGGSCMPVPGHFHSTLQLSGTPAQASLALSRYGQQLLDTTVQFTYQQNQPNGSQCGPICQQASTQVSFAADVGDAETTSIPVEGGDGAASGGCDASADGGSCG